MRRRPRGRRSERRGQDDRANESGETGDEGSGGDVGARAADAAHGAASTLSVGRRLGVVVTVRVLSESYESPEEEESPDEDAENHDPDGFPFRAHGDLDGDGFSDGDRRGAAQLQVEARLSAADPRLDGDAHARDLVGAGRERRRVLDDQKRPGGAGDDDERHRPGQVVADGEAQWGVRTPQIDRRRRNDRDRSEVSVVDSRCAAIVAGHCAEAFRQPLPSSCRMLARSGQSGARDPQDRGELVEGLGIRTQRIEGIDAGFVGGYFRYADDRCVLREETAERERRALPVGLHGEDDVPERRLVHDGRTIDGDEQRTALRLLQRRVGAGFREERGAFGSVDTGGFRECGARRAVVDQKVGVPGSGVTARCRVHRAGGNQRRGVVDVSQRRDDVVSG